MGDDKADGDGRALLGELAVIAAAEREALNAELAMVGPEQYRERCRERQQIADAQRAAQGWRQVTLWHGSRRDRRAAGELDELAAELDEACAGRSWTGTRGLDFTRVNVSGPDAERVVTRIAAFASTRPWPWRVQP
jgi:hypothetical protein